MAEELRLECLGGMQITRGGMPLTGYVSVKAPALLCYLAVTGRPQFRLVLAGLLWGDLPEEDACANLRKVLSNLRDLVGDHLIITPHAVAFDRESVYWLDTEAFLKLTDQIDTGMRNRGSPPESLVSAVSASTPAEPAFLSDLLRAAELYQGDFLSGFYVRHAPLFEEWVAGQRDRLRRLAGRVLKQLTDYYAGCGELERAITYTARLLALEPWQEEVHRRMMVLLARNGERGAALAQYEMCRRLLKKELNVEPMAETTALYWHIRATGAPRPYNLPAQTTSFVGRSAELAQIAKRLADPRCRLVSILGPVGVGKTRLALEAAAAANDRLNDAFLSGIFFVPLQTVHTIGDLVGAIAAAAKCVLPSRANLQEELLQCLHDRELLLILDGFEHLVNEAGFLTILLQRAPRIKLLVTSQQRLKLAGEWAMALAGLPYAVQGQQESVDLEMSPAVQLFIQRAQQVRPGLSLSVLDKQAIAYICELVEGFPLAIELAAAWTCSMSCQELAQAMEAGAETLTALAQDMPLRHRSLRASFEHSRKLLSPHEQQILGRLAVCRGGFTREAAEQVAGADLTTLAGLLDKSLLRIDPGGRYGLHAVLRWYAERMLRENPVEYEMVRQRHADYYLGAFLEQCIAEMRAGRQEEAVGQFHSEIANLQVAYRWTATRARQSVAERDRLHQVDRFIGDCDDWPGQQVSSRDRDMVIGMFQ